MANEPVRTYKHILLPQRGVLKVYAPRGGPHKISVRQNNRTAHSAKLVNQLGEIQSLEILRRHEREVVKNFAANGICITFQGAPDFDLLFEKLEFPKDGIELLSVFERDNHTEATCYIPEGKLDVFLKRIQDYATKDTRFNRPAYADLVNSIDNIKAAALREFWTDENPIPETTEPIWWEVWLRTKDSQTTLAQLQQAAEALQIELSGEYLSFPERLIVQILASPTTLTKSIEILNLVSEIRMGNRKPSPRIFPSRFESNEILQKVQDKLSFNVASTVGVAILDTGVNRGHPLLASVLADSDMHSSYDHWLPTDHHGHGTTMAGLAAFGDLWNALKSPYSIDVPYLIESIKILPPLGENPPHLFGKVVEMGIQKCEGHTPDRKRVYSKSITSDLHKSGSPSSYSAKIDELASGATDHKRRLFVISAGNTDGNFWHNYPTSNFTSGVEEPAQAWNALTVGAYTELVDFPDDNQYLGWTSVAPQGDLSPYSCTSVLWAKSSWPYKPDIVWEGGNCALQPGVTNATEADSLSLLTTNWQPTSRLFTTSCMTSASTAQVAGLAGKLLSLYPSIWPETIRAVIIHSANWTQAMKARFPINNKLQKEHLLRACGYGVPNEKLALNSLSNNVILITQDEIQPFQITKGKGKAKQLQIHNLPWPKDVLNNLGETEVSMRVTLSYFIEPNPAQRGWQSKFKYQSFGLRFDLKRKDETEHRFEKRVSKLASEDKPIQDDSIKDIGWTLGEQLRNKGSIHSDIWTGTAVALAARNRIAIYPVLGWWRERLALGKCEKKARYSLIVSITSPDESINLYEKIQLELGIPVENLIDVAN